MNSNSPPSCDAHDERKTENNSSSNTLFDSRTWNDFLKVSEDSDRQDGTSSAEEVDDSVPTTMEEFDELEVDEDALQERDKDASEVQLAELKEQAIALKNAGNEHFYKTEYKEATRAYTKGLNTCPLKYDSNRSVLFANRAAARINLNDKDGAVLDCNKAIELNPTYMKALVRRAQLHRKMDNLERALEDYKKILELDRNNAEAREACATLPPEINEKNEKLKDEMFGKLKELGNMCLKPFGLSTDNFQVVQDPNSGGYSINFQQNR